MSAKSLMKRKVFFPLFSVKSEILFPYESGAFSVRLVIFMENC